MVFSLIVLKLFSVQASQFYWLYSFFFLLSGLYHASDVILKFTKKTCSSQLFTRNLSYQKANRATIINFLKFASLKL